MILERGNNFLSKRVSQEKCFPAFSSEVPCLNSQTVFENRMLVTDMLILDILALSRSATSLLEDTVPDPSSEVFIQLDDDAGDTDTSCSTT